MLGRPPLEGERLPDLASVSLPADAIPKGKAALICLFDVDQRPSRQMLRLLGEKQEHLKQKGVSILGVQSVVSRLDALQEWQKNNPVPFPVGRVAEKTASTHWAAEVETLPWLILVNKEGLVTAEGFSMDELDARINQTTK